MDKLDLYTAFSKLNDEEFNKYVGKIISERRKELGISANTLSEMVHIDDSNLRRMEKGQSGVRGVNLIKLCICLKLDINEFKQVFDLPSNMIEHTPK